MQVFEVSEIKVVAKVDVSVLVVVCSRLVDVAGLVTEDVEVLNVVVEIDVALGVPDVDADIEVE